MGQDLLASKIVVQEEQPQIRSVPALPTAVFGLVGTTERGPVGIATFVTSFDEFVRKFGGDYANADIVHQARGFFQGGGQFMWVVRTVHYTDITDPTTKTSVAGTISLDDDTGPSLKLDGASDGAYANALKVRIADATDGDADHFNLYIEDSGVVIESWPNLTMDDTSTAFVETLMNNADTGSLYLKATDRDSAGSQRPENGTFGPLTGGDDGLTDIADIDYVGDVVGKTGLRAFDLVSDLTILAVPGRAVPAVQQAMYQYSELVKNRAVFCIMDSPANSTAVGIVTYFGVTAALLEATEVGAAYWPRVKVLNPSTDIYGLGQTLTVAPSGHIAGLFARNDAKRQGGIYNPPAGIEDGQLIGVVGLESTEPLDETKRDYVFPKRINPITMLPGGGGYFLDGSRGLKSNGNFPTVAERRGASYIEQSIKAGLEFARHKNNDRKLRKTCERTATVFLLTQMRNGAFRSTDPKKAFFVDFGEGLNPPSAQFAGKMYARIGLATQKPAEFIILAFSQDTRALEEEVLAAQR